MATISRTGITGGGTIEPTHITNIIDALDGTSITTTVVATGSFSGSLVGELTGTASFALTATSSSYATTASYALNGGGGGVTIDNNTNNYLVTATGTANTLNGEADLTFDGSVLYVGEISSVNFSKVAATGGIGFRIPTAQPNSPAAGSMYWDDATNTLYIYSANSAAWVFVTLGG